jgi:hypothetical protein
MNLAEYIAETKPSCWAACEREATHFALMDGCYDPMFPAMCDEHAEEYREAERVRAMDDLQEARG